MKDLFWGIVAVLNSICAKTGLSYAAINILIYTFLLPASWAAIVWFRKKRHGWIILAHASLSVAYCANHQNLVGASQYFYDANIRALEWLGAIFFSIGYIKISILIGILLPTFLFATLCLFPVRHVLFAYILFLIINLLYYTWVLTLFSR